MRGKSKDYAKCLVCDMMLQKVTGRFCKRHSEEFWNLRGRRSYEGKTDEDIIKMMRTKTVPKQKKKKSQMDESNKI